MDAEPTAPKARPDKTRVPQQGMMQGLLTVADLMAWRRVWLGNVYPWAGQERSVNLGKRGFQQPV